MEAKRIKLSSQVEVPDEGQKNPFEILNDDCILHIFSFLNIQDLESLSSVWPRFYDVTEMIYKAYKTLDFRKISGLTFQQQENFLEKVGKTLQTVTCSGSTAWDSANKVVYLIPMLCPNIKCLQFKSTCEIEPLIYQKFKILFRQLTSLTLSDCVLTDTECSLLKYSQYIRYLNLSFNDKITGKHLDSLPNLKSLFIYRCMNFEPKHFIALCRVSKLSVLNISDCHKLNKNSLEALQTTQTDLEMLYISNNLQTDDLTDIVKLPNLRSLIFEADNEIKHDFLNKLVEYKSETLKVLIFTANIFVNSMEKISSSILRLTGLEKLSLREMPIDRFLAELDFRIPNLKMVDFACNDELNYESIISYIVKAKNLEFINVSDSIRSEFRFEFAIKLINALKIANRPKAVKVVLGRTSIPDSTTRAILAEHRELLNLSYEPWKIFPHHFVHDRSMDEILDISCF